MLHESEGLASISSNKLPGGTESTREKPRREGVGWKERGEERKRGKGQREEAENRTRST